MATTWDKTIDTDWVKIRDTAAPSGGIKYGISVDGGAAVFRWTDSDTAPTPTRGHPIEDKSTETLSLTQGEYLWARDRDGLGTVNLVITELA